MSYFPSDIPFMSEDERKENGIKIPRDSENSETDSCEGCKHIGLWENEYEYGISCPCLRCRRRMKDNYEPERRITDD